MTCEDWLACSDPDALSFELGAFPTRKLHLLTAALLRRVWDILPSDHSRFAVEATEKFADGLITADALAWARSQAARESHESVWLGQSAGDDYVLFDGWACCPACEAATWRYECRVAKQGGILDGAQRGLEEPAWIAACAAFYALALEPHTAGLKRATATWAWEWGSVFATAREVLGEAQPDPRWPEWRTTDVLALARAIYRDRAFENLPILADALQDAGCDDEDVLWHCRRPGGHRLGCWALDLALGLG
jgi:hypothetical protein